MSSDGDGGVGTMLVVVLVLLVALVVVVLTRCNHRAPRILIMSYSKYIAG